MNKLDHRKTYIARRNAPRRDALVSRKHGERISDINAACTAWLLKRCPGYAEEVRMCFRGVTFGKQTKP